MNKSDLKNGMIVTLRRRVKRVIIGKRLFDEQGVTTNILDNYNNDLIHINNCNSEDIMKIEYGGKIIWERTGDVPFGAKVRVWDDNSDEDKLVGRFIYYEEGYAYPFLVFVEDEKDTNWYHYCEIIEEEK